MRGIIIQIILFTLLICNIVTKSYGQKCIGLNKNEYLFELSQQKNVVNVKVYKDSVTYNYIIYENKIFSREIKFFNNDVCYKYVSILSKHDFDLTKSAMIHVFGNEIYENVWIHTTRKNEILYNILITLSTDDNSTRLEVISYTKYEDYLLALENLGVFKIPKH